MDWHIKLSRAMRVATEAAREAGALMLKELPLITAAEADQKGPGDFVTRVDRESERIIRDRISKAFPGDAIMSEETGSGMPEAADLWIVDPLDGTTNYMHHFPQFCVCIAYAVNRRPEIGVIYDPLHNDLFTCKRDEGVWHNGTPMAVSDCHEMKYAYVTTGLPSRFKDQADDFMRGFKNVFLGSAAVRRTGSAGLDLAYVAAGRFDAFWEPRLSPWDMAAGSLLVTAAGGIVTDENGGPWSIQSRGIIAGNPTIHAEILKLVTG
jgi:myo-inositol-1(or 4)-monophosphatase